MTRILLTIFIILCSLLNDSLSMVIDEQCRALINGDALFLIEQLALTNDYQYKLPDGSIIYFNFCNYVINKCDDLSIDTFALIQSADNKTCTKLASGQSSFDKAITLIDEQELKLGIHLVLKYGDVFSRTQTLEPVTLKKTVNVTRWEIEFIIKCNDTLTNSTVPYYVEEYQLQDNRYIMTGHSGAGCPSLVVPAVWDFLGDKRIIFAVIIFFVGVFFNFFGFQMKIPTLFIIGFMSGFAGVIFIVGEIISNNDIPELAIWILLILASMVGTMFGYITTQIQQIGYFALGCWLGIVLAFIMNNAFFYQIDTGDNNMILYISIGVFGMMLGILSFYLHEHLVIISTCMIGGYSIIRPFGFFFQDFPNQFTIVKQIKYGQVSEVNPTYYLYMALIFLVGGIGVQYQYHDFLKARRLKKLEEQQKAAAEKGIDLDIDELEQQMEAQEEQEEKKKSLVKNLLTKNQPQKKEEPPQKQIELQQSKSQHIEMSDLEGFQQNLEEEVQVVQPQKQTLIKPKKQPTPVPSDNEDFLDPQEDFEEQQVVVKPVAQQQK